jgi:hypothetical protein
VTTRSLSMIHENALHISIRLLVVVTVIAVRRAFTVKLAVLDHTPAWVRTFTQVDTDTHCRTSTGALSYLQYQHRKYMVSLCLITSSRVAPQFGHSHVILPTR